MTAIPTMALGRGMATAVPVTAKVAPVMATAVLVTAIAVPVTATAVLATAMAVPVTVVPLTTGGRNRASPR